MATNLPSCWLKKKKANCQLFSKRVYIILLQRYVLFKVKNIFNQVCCRHKHTHISVTSVREWMKRGHQYSWFIKVNGITGTLFQALRYFGFMEQPHTDQSALDGWSDQYHTSRLEHFKLGRPDTFMLECPPQCGCRQRLMAPSSSKTMIPKIINSMRWKVYSSIWDVVLPE